MNILKKCKSETFIFEKKPKTVFPSVFKELGYEIEL